MQIVSFLDISGDAGILIEAKNKMPLYSLSESPSLLFTTIWNVDTVEEILTGDTDRVVCQFL